MSVRLVHVAEGLAFHLLIAQKNSESEVIIQGQSVKILKNLENFSRVKKKSIGLISKTYVLYINAIKADGKRFCKKNFWR